MISENLTELQIQEQMSETDGYDWALKTILGLQKERSAAQRHVSSLKRQLAGTTSLLVSHGIDLERLNESK